MCIKRYKTVRTQVENGVELLVTFVNVLLGFQSRQVLGIELVTPIAELLRHAVEGHCGLSQFVITAHWHPLRKITFGQALTGGAQLSQLTHQIAAQ